MASPATSGTPRPVSAVVPALGTGGRQALCQAGTAKVVLTPPPLAPPWVPSFHTTSCVMVCPDAVSLVPPHASTYGLEAGKSTTLPPPTPSLEPLSPEATQTVTPIVAAACSALLNACSDCAVHEDSGPPQLIEMTDGLLVVS